MPGFFSARHPRNGNSGRVGVVEASSLARPSRPGEAVIKAFLFACAAFSILTTAGIVLILGKESFSFFSKVPIFDFLTGTVWQPAIGRFGILPLATATLTTSAIAMAVALPLGMMVAIYLSEYAPWKVAAVPQAGARSPRWHSDCRLRLFRPHRRDPRPCAASSGRIASRCTTCFRPVSLWESSSSP